MQWRITGVEVDSAHGVALPQGSLLHVGQRMRFTLSISATDTEVRASAGVHLQPVLAQPDLQLVAMGRQQADRQRVVEALA